MSKVYQVSDLFYTRWQQLSIRKQAEVYALYKQIEHLDSTTTEYGFHLIKILRLIRRRPLLVDRINVEQAFDIFNELKFLREPWYVFPQLHLDADLCAPDEQMARSTLDHFIYADNEYTCFLATQDVKYLRRLVATLYQPVFDKENVEGIERTIRLKEYELSHVFFTYAQVREFVMKRCKTLLPKAAKPAADEEPEPIRPTGAMWLELKHRLSETPAFQGFITAGKAGMYDALDYLEGLAKQKPNAKP